MSRAACLFSWLISSGCVEISFSSGFDSRWSNSFAQCEPFKDTHSCWSLRKGTGLWGSSNTSASDSMSSSWWVDFKALGRISSAPPPRTLAIVQLSHQPLSCRVSDWWEATAFVSRDCVQKQLHSGIVLEVGNSNGAAGERWLPLKGSISGQVCLSHHSC